MYKYNAYKTKASPNSASRIIKNKIWYKYESIRIGLTWQRTSSFYIAVVKRRTIKCSSELWLIVMEYGSNNNELLVN